MKILGDSINPDSAQYKSQEADEYEVCIKLTPINIYPMQFSPFNLSLLLKSHFFEPFPTLQMQEKGFLKSIKSYKFTGSSLTVCQVLLFEAQLRQKLFTLRPTRLSLLGVLSEF